MMIGWHSGLWFATWVYVIILAIISHYESKKNIPISPDDVLPIFWGLAICLMLIWYVFLTGFLLELDNGILIREGSGVIEAESVHTN